MIGIEINVIHNEECAEGMRKFIPDESIDLVVTSPPYDNLRSYNGYSFNFEEIAQELWRVIKPGGVVVWVVGDATVKGSETGTSFRQALYFKDLGFNLHDTMIWNKGCFSAVGALKTRYAPVFEYMFVFIKGKAKTFNPIKDKPNKWAGTKIHGTVRNKDGSNKRIVGHNEKTLNDFGQRFNVWEISPQRQRGEKRHPAPFPEQLANDHILSWSNPGDIVLDPFMGSGTTAKMALLTDRKYIGFEMSEEYCHIIDQRLSAYKTEGA